MDGTDLAFIEQVVAPILAVPSAEQIARLREALIASPSGEVADYIQIQIGDLLSFQENRPDEAIAEYASVASRNGPQAARAQFKLAISLTTSKRSDEAMSACRDLVSRFPNGIYALQATGLLRRLALRAGDTTTAAAALAQLREQLGRHEGKEGNVKSILVDLLLEEDKIEEAIQLLEADLAEAIRENAGPEMVHFLEGYITELRVRQGKPTAEVISIDKRKRT